MMGDVNSEISEGRMKTFCNTYNFKHLIKEPLRMLVTQAV